MEREEEAAIETVFRREESAVMGCWLVPNQRIEGGKPLLLLGECVKAW